MDSLSSIITELKALVYSLKRRWYALAGQRRESWHPATGNRNPKSPCRAGAAYSSQRFVRVPALQQSMPEKCCMNFIL